MGPEGGWTRPTMAVLRCLSEKQRNHLAGPGWGAANAWSHPARNKQGPIPEREQIVNKPLIGCAMRKELKVLRVRLGAHVDYLMTGLGGPRTTRQLEESFETLRPPLFIFTGTAGQLSPSLQMGEVVFPQAWYREDGARFPSDPSYVQMLTEKKWTIFGNGLTVRKPVLKSDTRRQLHEKWNALICDMESAWALETAARFQVPCLAFKVISDTAESGIFTYWARFEEVMNSLADYLERLLADLRL